MNRSRPPDVIALLFGLLFTAIGLVVLVDRVGVLSDARWLWPALLVSLGVVMLAVGTGGRRRRRPSEQPGHADDVSPTAVDGP